MVADGLSCSDRQRGELPQLLLEAVLADGAGRRLVCVQPRPPLVALFRQVAGLRACDGCFYVEEREGL